MSFSTHTTSLEQSEARPMLNAGHFPGYADVARGPVIKNWNRTTAERRTAGGGSSDWGASWAHGTTPRLSRSFA